MARSFAALSFCLLLMVSLDASAAAPETPETRQPTLGEAMAGIRITAQDRLLKLEEALAAPQAREKKVALKQEMNRVKFELALDLLRVQLEYATERGDAALVTELQTAIDRMLNPPDLNDPAAQQKSRERQPLPRAGEESK